MHKAIDILLVEDNPGDARLVREAFSEGGLDKRLHHVEDGVLAMEFLRREGEYAAAPRPDVILLDLNLPRMNGHEVLAEIRRSPALKSIPVVTLTTSIAREDVERCYFAGVNAYIQKPLDFNGFIHVVRRFEEFWLGTATLPPTD